MWLCLGCSSVRTQPRGARTGRGLEMVELLHHPWRIELGGVRHERDRALEQARQRRALLVERAVGAEIGVAAFAVFELGQIVGARTRRSRRQARCLSGRGTRDAPHRSPHGWRRRNGPSGRCGWDRRHGRRCCRRPSAPPSPMSSPPEGQVRCGASRYVMLTPTMPLRDRPQHDVVVERAAGGALVAADEAAAMHEHEDRPRRCRRASGTNRSSVLRSCGPYFTSRVTLTPA